MINQKEQQMRPGVHQDKEIWCMIRNFVDATIFRTIGDSREYLSFVN